MTFRLIRLAPGSYDLELDGAIIASVVRDSHGGHHAMKWYAELLDEAGPRPAPFLEPLHEFGSFDEVAAWLGYPATVNVTPAGLSARPTAVPS
jgi:hypothetical protein